MSSTQTLTELASSIQVKDIITFSINAQYLNTNFAIVKQCLLKMQELEGSLGQEKQASKEFSERLKQAEMNIKVNQDELKKSDEKVRELQSNVGDEFMKRMYGIEQKTKNMFAFEDTVAKLEAMDKFVTLKQFKETASAINSEIEQAKSIKNQFERYVQINAFDAFKETNATYHLEKEEKIKKLTDEISSLNVSIDKAREKIEDANREVQENTKMIKEINFPDMMQKNKRFKEETEQKMNELILKMKKKVGSNELIALEQTMIEKLDKFLSDNEKNKAEKEETRDALVFLEKRITEIEMIFADKASEEEKDALFSVKKWQCASCTKDLGKFEGRLGQYRPWSIFPCKELDPEKTGGFGYMSYLDKVSIKKAASVSEENNMGNTERINKTFNQKESDISPKRGASTSRTNNVISNYGVSSEDKGTVGLKQAYFRELRTQKGDRNAKFFRVKKEASKPANEFQKIKQV